MDSAASLRRFTLSLVCCTVAFTVLLLRNSAAAAPVTFIFSSDVHFGINRGKFRGDANVESRVVNAAMVETLNALPALKFPKDHALRAGDRIGAVDFLVITGDLTNRQERLPLKIQSASTSWAQFDKVFSALQLRNAAGQPAPLLLVPGNHDVSNAIGHPNGLLPATDATTMAALYNRFMAPATPRTKDNYDFTTEKILYSRDFGGAHCIFLSLWPDTTTRAWIAADLKKIPATTPVFLFAHDAPKVDARHFTNPHGAHDVNAIDKFENVIADVYSGDKSDGPTTTEQRALATFLKAHPNIVAYFHGHENYTEFYTWKGPDKDLALACFRSDSPMKGRDSGKEETKLAFQVITYDTTAGQLTARECLWNAHPKKSAAAAIEWGQSATIDLRPR